LFLSFFASLFIDNCYSLFIDNCSLWTALCDCVIIAFNGGIKVILEFNGVSKIWCEGH